MYVKKNQQSMAGKDPLLGVSAIFKQALERRRNKREAKRSFAPKLFSVPFFSKKGTGVRGRSPWRGRSGLRAGRCGFAAGADSVY